MLLHLFTSYIRFGEEYMNKLSSQNGNFNVSKKGMLFMATQASQIYWVLFKNLRASSQKTIEHKMLLVNS
jgi:hypothetical protein